MQNNKQNHIKQSLYYTLAILSLLTLNALADEGGISEGGGLSVVCRDSNGKPQSAQTLDLFEGEQLRGMPFDSKLLGQDEWSIARNIIKRIRQWDPVRAESYSRRLDTFTKEARFLPNSTPRPVDDAHSLILPIGCNLEQAALQREPEFPEDPRYIFDKSIWDVMNLANRASLVIHEIVYREARDLFQTNSKKARYYNSMLSSTATAELSKERYETICSAVYFRIQVMAQSESVKVFFLNYAGWIDQKCDTFGLKDAVLSDEELEEIRPVLNTAVLENTEFAARTFTVLYYRSETGKRTFANFGVDANSNPRGSFELAGRLCQ